VGSNPVLGVDSGLPWIHVVGEPGRHMGIPIALHESVYRVGLALGADPVRLRPHNANPWLDVPRGVNSCELHS